MRRFKNGGPHFRNLEPVVFGLEFEQTLCLHNRNVYIHGSVSRDTGKVFCHFAELLQLLTEGMRNARRRCPITSREIRNGQSTVRLSRTGTRELERSLPREARMGTFAVRECAFRDDGSLEKIAGFAG